MNGVPLSPPKRIVPMAEKLYRQRKREQASKLCPFCHKKVRITLKDGLFSLHTEYRSKAQCVGSYSNAT